MTKNQSKQIGTPGQPGWEPVPGVKLRHTLRGHNGWVGRIAWSPDGKWLASPSADRTIRIWGANEGTLIEMLEGHTNDIGSVSWSPDGSFLASGSWDKTVRIWATTSWECHRIEPHWEEVVIVAWSPRGQWLASGGVYGNIQIWEAANGRIHRRYNVHNEIYDLEWSHDLILASCSEDRKVRLWTLNQEQPSAVFHRAGFWVLDVAWSPEQSCQLLALAGYDRTIRIWDKKLERTINVLEGHTDCVKSIAISTDGRILASRGRDHTIRLWRTDTWEAVAVIDEPASIFWPPGVAFHPSESLLATVGSDPDTPEEERDRLIHIWELDIDILLGDKKGRPSTIESVKQTTAKIVLVGDSGVGKSGIGWRLAHGEFKEQISTHGQQFWLLNQLSGQRSDGTKCEAVLWDLAGQPDYRLIHALFIDDADLALVVFDPTNNREPLSGPEYWIDQLAPGCPKILVAARADRGSSVLTKEELESFCRSRGLHGYVETSALTELGLDELLERMNNAID